MTRPLRRRLAALSALLPPVLLQGLVLLAGLVLLPTAASASGAASPTVQAATAPATLGTTTTVTGSGWPGNALIILLLCGQDALSGTDSCANATGHATTTRPDGSFSVPLEVVAPPKPCPCVIHATTVLGTTLTVDTPIILPGVPVVPIPAASTAAELQALNQDVSGDSGLMNWFGAPAHRTLKVIIANMGNIPVSDPVFRLGTSSSVYAPTWQDFQWNGVIAPGAKQEIDVPVDFGSGAHGDYKLQLDYGNRELTFSPVSLPRSWGVTLFWLLLWVVIPVGLFRIGMAILDRLRPDLATRRDERYRARRDRKRAELGRRRAGDPLPVPTAPGQGPSFAAQDTLVMPPMPNHPPATPPERWSAQPPSQPGRPAGQPVLPWFPAGTIPSLSQVRTPGSQSTSRKGT
ncbi:hypothetical protein [Streptacidiphilus sp. EB129]|uniref:hypothetical protein n=1 Tax=Streptacidiphilus sp. EB129 TaxID=3156262 RepID=UPI0035127CEB